MCDRGDVAPFFSSLGISKTQRPDLSSGLHVSFSNLNYFILESSSVGFESYLPPLVAPEFRVVFCDEVWEVSEPDLSTPDVLRGGGATGVVAIGFGYAGGT